MYAFAGETVFSFFCKNESIRISLQLLRPDYLGDMKGPYVYSPLGDDKGMKFFFC